MGSTGAGDRLRSARKSAGLSQEDVAGAASVSRRTVQRMEEDPGSTSLRDVEAYLQACGHTLGYLAPSEAGPVLAIVQESSVDVGEAGWILDAEALRKILSADSVADCGQAVLSTREGLSAVDLLVRLSHGVVGVDDQTARLVTEAVRRKLNELSPARPSRQ